MTPNEIAAAFTGQDGSFHFARWRRPVAPVVFGLADESLAVFRDVIRAVFAHARHPLAETDPDMGANLMLFVVRDWDELAGVPDLAALVGQDDLPARLTRDGAERYQLFRFDPDGSIRACFSFLRLGGRFSDAHVGQLAELVAVNATLAFAQPMIPSTEMAALIRAAYDPVLPVASDDPALALRLGARLEG